MSIHRIGDSDLEYHLVCFDKDAHERIDPDGTLASETLLSRLKDPARPVSDVFFASHGWKGDVPAALEQYDAWFGAAANAMGGVEHVRQSVPDFAPLIVGLHWPSLPWGVEQMPQSTQTVGTLSAEDVEDADALEKIAASIADTVTACEAIRTLLKETSAAKSTTLTSGMHEAYMTLFKESDLRADGVNGRPGFDLDHFEPQEIVNDPLEGRAPDTAGHEMLLGVADDVRNALLSPLRTLSFWKMKDRARSIGETGARSLLDAMQRTAPEARIHLMGHSFGCIVVSAMAAGPQRGDTLLKRPVDSLFLVQGALSLWAYANDIPYARTAKGYFHRIVAQALVRGPVVTTRSVHDNAVGRFYPLGARFKAQRLLGESFPEYGGIGAFGIQGVAGEIPVTDIRMKRGDTQFEVSEPGIYNIDASDVICDGSGPSGAHSDIAHPEVAHAFWASVNCAIDIARRARAREMREGQLLEDAKLKIQAMKGSRGSAAGGLLSAEVEPNAGVATQAVSQPSRWINASFEEHDPQTPLLKDEWYQLAFDVDIEARPDSIVATEVPESVLTSAYSEYVFLTVRIDTDDFDISNSVSRIRVPRVGRGQTKALFDVSPKHNGRATIKTTILRDGNFVQQIILTFDIGAGHASQASVTTRGRSLSDAQVLGPRDVGLEISPGVDGYECTVWGPVHSSARLSVSREYLDFTINSAREALLSVVKQTVGGDPVFQTGIDIPECVSKKALRRLAEAGSNLMYVLFEGPDASEDSKNIATFLRKLCGPEAASLKMQIIAAKLPVPWSMLYLGGVGEADTIDWNNFLGMRHIVEQIPLQRSLSVWEHGIASNKPKLAVGVHLNEDIDNAIPGGYVQGQRDFWSGTPFSVTTRLTRTHLLRALNDPAMADQILYFYCHAISRGLTEPGGPDGSYLLLSEESKVTLADLRRNASTDIKLAGKPLVFINACESAELSSTFYDGFVPYFMNKGARGVIGTECLTPAYFATEWAKRFFIRFLGGQRLGEACLDLRREFMEEHGNPLGLLYAVHCDADTRIMPPADVALAA
jgi:hypothetical protein